MTKVLILSDSHGLTNEVAEIKKRHQLKNMIHCGDSELDMDAPELDGFLKVGGNTDHDSRLPEEQNPTINDVNFYVTHGHLYDVKANLLTLAYRAEEVDASVVCFGHTHIAGVEQVGNRLFINPGSIRLPKKRSEKTYAILEWESQIDVIVTFYTIDGEVIEDLSHRATI
ncbi:putative phosphoesterase [Virgibacillus natechei]|uniref:Phosphoesterase n=1 Tax=Virgibacillus natechei TaxID=1216297 RepID=A0ABS4ID11_9BACI|nr:metallophosphoesterase [Virgibacillus natechei]MBP1968821.1 putative phosphoesterase [Virgibacillus natechei]UZD11620.1 metallophosphoesterase [Virgibacillus natechei]